MHNGLDYIKTYNSNNNDAYFTCQSCENFFILRVCAYLHLQRGNNANNT